MTRTVKKLPLLFLIGAIIYPIIEILYRGYTHFSMAILGGVCFCSLFLIDKGLGPGKLLLKAFLSAIVITQLEFLCGVLVNLVLNLSVWDYSDRAFNILGQVCPLFSFYWFILCLFVLSTLSFEKEISQRKTLTMDS